MSICPCKHTNMVWEFEHALLDINPIIFDGGYLCKVCGGSGASPHEAFPDYFDKDDEWVEPSTDQKIKVLKRAYTEIGSLLDHKIKFGQARLTQTKLIAVELESRGIANSAIKDIMDWSWKLASEKAGY